MPVVFEVLRRKQKSIRVVSSIERMRIVVDVEYNEWRAVILGKDG